LRAAGTAHRVSIADDKPGFDRHDWESAWASIEEESADDPDAAVSQLAGLAEEILEANGYRVRDPVERAGDEAEVIRSYLAARETAERAELGDASRGEVEAALDDLRAIYDTLVEPAS
jgi:hypothetical protein